MSEFEIRLLLHAVQADLLHCLNKLDNDTEYLRQELEQQLQGAEVLLGKMDMEAQLKQDRAVLHGNPSPQDLSTWISGTTSD